MTLEAKEAAELEAAKAPAENPGEEESGKDGETQAKWLNARLAKAQAKGQAEFIKSLGVADAEEIKSALALKREQAEAKKSLEEKLSSQSSELTAAQQRLATYETAVKTQADAALSALPEDKQAIIATLAGEDPAKIISVIAQLAPTWAAKAAVEKPDSTTGSGKGPAGLETTTTVDHKAEYESIKKTNPVAAANYRFAHFKEVTGG